MTISTNAVRNEYTATGGQTTFNYTFKIYSSTAGEDLNVYQTPSGQDFDDSTGLITTYSITGAGNAAGGTIVLNTGATAGDRITIVSAIDEARTTDYQVNGDFDTTTVNNDFDRVVSLVKQQSEKLERALKLPESVQTSASLDLPTPAASSFIRWKADLTGLENVNLATDAGASNAALVTYSNATSGLSATDVQAAVDEIVAGGVEIGVNGFVFAGTTDARDFEIVTEAAGALGGLHIRPVSAEPGGSVNGGVNLYTSATGAGGCNAADIILTGTTTGSATMLYLTPTSSYVSTANSLSTLSSSTICQYWEYTAGAARTRISVPLVMEDQLKVKSYALASLPTGSAGAVIYVSDASRSPSGTGTLCFHDGSNWIDVTTGATVA